VALGTEKFLKKAAKKPQKVFSAYPKMAQNSSLTAGLQHLCLSPRAIASAASAPG
jgi:hypothetical protein